MSFLLNRYELNEIRWGDATSWRQGRLTVEREAVCAVAAADARLAGVEAHLLTPGDPARVVHVLDVVEPRCKGADGSAFPGFLGPPTTGGDGATHALTGMAVLTAGEFADAAFDTVVSVAEAVIDMSGPLAELSPFSRTRNLVLCCRPAAGVAAPQAAAAIRLAALRVAQHLAAATRGAEPTVVDAPPAGGAGPRIVLILQLTRTGNLYDSFVYGRNVEGMLPTLLLPEELADGAVVSGNYRYANHRTPTYLYQNHPVLQALGRRGVRPVGVIVFRGSANDQAEKERTAAFCAKLAGMRGATGAVLCPEAGGHSMMEIMLICRACERAGVRTALISEELGGPDGADNPFVDFVPEADLIISAGNQDELVDLPRMPQVVGGARLLETGADAYGGGRLPLRNVLCATNQSGGAKLRAVAF